MSTPRHFLDLDRLPATTLRAILESAKAMKRAGRNGSTTLAGRTLALIFEKPSTRTRVSFEVAMRQLGGGSVVLDAQGSHLGVRETIADTARVLGCYVDAIMLRTDKPQKLDDMAAAGAVPVINGLTDATHPCQLMADVMTYEERKGTLKGATVAWCGDGNNVAASWIHAAERFGFTLRLAVPEALRPDPARIRWATERGAKVSLHTDPKEAVSGADCVATDTWVSMGNNDAERRMRLLTPYRVDAALMRLAKPDALFLHCLPAHRGEEVTDEVLDGPQSAVWDEAENRLHTEKAILAWCINGTRPDA
ncbi:MAG: ornithine carbamoyltransferase [Alphaproteobacteria bacterium]|nr:ornithine carbamoyltransferase [Alphaproteobacteria bacterium]